MESMNIEDYENVLKKDQDMREKAEKYQKKKKIKKGFIKGLFFGIICLTAGVAAVVYLKPFETSLNFSVTEKQSVQTNEEIIQNNKETYLPMSADNYKELGNEYICPRVCVLDATTNKVIAGKGYSIKMYPASLTKIMTLIVAVENIPDLSQTYALNFQQCNYLYIQEASVAGFMPGEQISANDCLYGLILPSGADAAIALSEMTAGTEEAFVELMNKKCQELGLKNTHFVNPTGLFDSNQYTTPLEMSMIMEYAMSNPICAEVLGTSSYVTTSTSSHSKGIYLTSLVFSRLKKDICEGVKITGGKTGYVDEAGNCLVTYQIKNNHPYIICLGGAGSKWDTIADDEKMCKELLPDT